MSDQSLRVEEVKHTIQPVVSPITLQQKFINMLNPSSTRGGQNQRSSGSPVDVRASSPTTCTVASPPLTTAKQHSKVESGSERTNGIERVPNESGTQLLDLSSKRDGMQFFQEQEKSLHDSFLSLNENAQKKQRPFVAKPQQAAGLDHLDNLIRLMEQLTYLKDENKRLRKHCDYLEGTKTLLQAKRELISEGSSSYLGFITPQSHRKHLKHNQYEHRQEKHNQQPVELPVEGAIRRRENGVSRPWISNSQELECLPLADSSSDQEPKKTKPSKHKRSLSAGAVEIILNGNTTIGEINGKTRFKVKQKRGISKHKSKTSKWSRVKKVITGNKFYEDLGTAIRTIGDRSRSPHGDHSISGATSSPQGLSYTSTRNTDSDVRYVCAERTSSATGSFLTKRSTFIHRNQGDDLTSDIWMGPPDWWNEYEARKESGATSADSEDSSIIEITTMYLGSKKDPTISKISSTTPAPSPTAILQEKYLTIEDTLPAIQLTSSLSLKEAGQKGDTSKLMSESVESPRVLHKASSGKSADLDIKRISDHPEDETRLEKKTSRSAWDRVKDIIHNRRDSIKRKLKRDKPGLDSEEMREGDIDALLEDQMRPDILSESLLRRPMPRVSPIIARKQKTCDSPMETTAKAPKTSTSKATIHKSGGRSGNIDTVVLLAGNVTEEFSKKMLQWEQLRLKKRFFTVRDDSDLGSLDLSKMPPEFPIRTIDLRDFRGYVPDSASDGVATEESNTSMEVLGAPSISVEETHRKKGRCSPKTQEQMKHEKGQIKVKKQRVRSLECEEKLEKNDEQVNQTGPGASCQDDLNSFKGIQSDSLTEQEQTRSNLQTGSCAKTTEKICHPQHPSDQSNGESPDDTSQAETGSEASLGEMEDETCTTATQEKCLTTSNIGTLERANTQLLENLHKKEIEYVAVQEEVQKVGEKLLRVREDYATEMERFQSDLAKGKFAGPIKLEVGELEATVGKLEEKIKMMENFGEKLASSMESAAVGKWQSIEAEETIHKQLVDLIEQMKGMLVRASQSEEQSLKIMALSNFETFYTQAMKLQVQMNNLRLSHLERNREIMVIKRQLLLQEVNNLLLQADITRRETELYQFQEAKRYGTLKRWNTFGGSDRQRPQAQVELPLSTLTPTYLKAGPHTQKEVRPRQVEAPHINIPYMPEKMILALAGSSSNPMPASSSALEAASDLQATPPTTVLDQLHSDPQTTHEQPAKTDLESGVGDRHKHVSPLLGTYLAQQHGEGDRTLDEYQKIAVSLQLSQLANNIESRKHPLMQSSSASQIVSAESSVHSFQPERTKRSIKETINSLNIIPAISMETNTTTLHEGISVQKASFIKPEITTLCDSAPLHIEIAKLRRVKSIVEKGAPAFRREGKDESSACYSNIMDSLVVDETIPRQWDVLKPSFQGGSACMNDCSLSSSANERSELSDIDKRKERITDSEIGRVGGLSVKPSITDRQGLTNKERVVCSQSPTSPVYRNVLLRQNIEERDAKLKDYWPLSPSCSPAATRGKPQLPRQISLGKRSPSFSPITKKEPRSKSVGDMDRVGLESITSEPLQDVIKKFEKRASFCETNDRSDDLRKTQSPTLYLPRVGLVSCVRRVKPPAELLEESQRYRNGHSTYSTRILQRCLPKDDQQRCTANPLRDKDDVSSSVTERIYPDTSPTMSPGSSKGNSDLSLKLVDSSPTETEIVEGIVRKLSSFSGSEPYKGVIHFQELSDKRQLKKLSHSYSGQLERKSLERNLTERDYGGPRCSSSPSKKATEHWKSCDIALLSSPIPSTSDTPYKVSSSSSLLLSAAGVSGKQDLAARRISHQSVGSLGTAAASERVEFYKEEKCNAGASKFLEFIRRKPSRKSNNAKPQPVSTPSSPSPRKSREMIRSKWKSEKLSREKRDSCKLSAGFIPDRANANENPAETIGVLCKQSMVFDLGLWQYSEQPQGGQIQHKSGSRKIRSWNQSERSRHEVTDPSYDLAAEHCIHGTVLPNTTSARVSSQATSRAKVTKDIRPMSYNAEQEVIPSSPNVTKKKKSNKFLDYNWLQKSKKLFKVSK